MTYRESSCTGKIRHRSKNQAKKSMKSLANAEGKPVRQYNVYGCPYCAGFHLGHARPDIVASRKEIDTYNERMLLNG